MPKKESTEAFFVRLRGKGWYQVRKLSTEKMWKSKIEHASKDDIYSWWWWELNCTMGVEDVVVHWKIRHCTRLRLSETVGTVKGWSHDNHMTGASPKVVWFGGVKTLNSFTHRTRSLEWIENHLKNTGVTTWYACCYGWFDRDLSVNLSGLQRWLISVRHWIPKGSCSSAVTTLRMKWSKNGLLSVSQLWRLHAEVSRRIPQFWWNLSQVKWQRRLVWTLLQEV